MTILQAGFPKSGNYWLYRIIREGIELSGQEYTSAIRHHRLRESATELITGIPEQSEIDVLDIDRGGVSMRIGFRHHSRVTDIDRYLSKTSHVWTHSPILTGSLDTLSRFERIVYIIRDPRDVVVSMSHFAFSPYMLSEDPHGEPDPATYREHRAENLARDWARHVLTYLANRDFLPLYLVFYERLIQDFHTEVRNLLEFLSIESEADTIERIQSATSLPKMQAEAPNHVREGKTGQWSGNLSARQTRQIIGVASPVMQILGYDPDLESSAQPGPAALELPQDPGSISRVTIEEASKKLRRSSAQKLAYGAKFLFGPRSPSQKARVLIRKLKSVNELLWKLR